MSYVFIRAAWIRSKIQIMSEEKKVNVSENFVVCDVQKEYAEHLFKILAERFKGRYQFHLFYDIEKMLVFLKGAGAQVVLVGEEYGDEQIQKTEATKRFILTGNRDKKTPGSVPIFRYQSADDIFDTVSRGIAGITKKDTAKTEPEEKKPERTRGKGAVRIRDEPTRGVIGVYSPIHRIGKTRFALRLGQKIARQVPVLYLNMEGYSGGDYYFPGGADQDLGDLFYCLKQERDDHGLKISSMTVQSGGMDYIMPMKNEQDVRAVRYEEWTGLLDLILEKCIYEVIILDLGDAVDGLYDILRKCVRIYTPYICEGAAEAKLKQYEENLMITGYADVLEHTVKKLVGRGSRQTEKAGIG